MTAATCAWLGDCFKIGIYAKRLTVKQSSQIKKAQKTAPFLVFIRLLITRDVVHRGGHHGPLRPRHLILRVC